LRYYYYYGKSWLNHITGPAEGEGQTFLSRQVVNKLRKFKNDIVIATLVRKKTLSPTSFKVAPMPPCIKARLSEETIASYVFCEWHVTFEEANAWNREIRLFAKKVETKEMEKHNFKHGSVLKMYSSWTSTELVIKSNEKNEVANVTTCALPLSTSCMHSTMSSIWHSPLSSFTLVHEVQEFFTEKKWYRQVLYRVVYSRVSCSILLIPLFLILLSLFLSMDSLAQTNSCNRMHRAKAYEFFEYKPNVLTRLVIGEVVCTDRVVHCNIRSEAVLPHVNHAEWVWIMAWSGMFMLQSEELFSLVNWCSRRIKEWPRSNTWRCHNCS